MPNGHTPAGDAARAARTAKLKARFLEVYSEIGAAKKAAKRIGICTSTPWQWRAEDPAFAAAWEEIRDRQTEDVEATLYELAVGIDVPVHHQGVVIGNRKLTSDRAALALLRARKPDVYGDGGPRVRGAAINGYRRNGERGAIVERTSVRISVDEDEGSPTGKSCVSRADGAQDYPSVALLKASAPRMEGRLVTRATSQVGRAGPARCDKASSSHCPHARRCGSATRTGRAC
jgi:hypothetical protein